MYKQVTNDLLQFIGQSPSCYHVINQFRKMLTEEGYQELREYEEWNLSAENEQNGGRYFAVRNESSIIAFRIPCRNFRNFLITASHSDSPSFKIKENEELPVDGHYIELNTERYGGMLCAPWFDRPLSVAGRAVVRTENGMEQRLVNIDRDLLMIPNVAIHMNRQANDGYAYHAQKDMVPLFGDETAKGRFKQMIAEAAGASEEDILGTDLFLYNRMPGTIWGASEEFFSCTKLDDLQCAWTSMKGFLAGKNKESAAICCVFDNEEVGSGTKQGADSTFLTDVLARINQGIGRTQEQYRTAVAGSFMVSADNAHAVHPNHMDKADPTNRPHMNGGPVIKFNANQKYTTDAVSCAVFRQVCGHAGVPCQTFANHSDVAGGSTLGNISNAHLSLDTVDIGLAQLAMHSPYETAGIRDTWYMIRALEAFYSAVIIKEPSANGVTIRISFSE